MQHGKASTYSVEKCRCAECRTAWAEMVQRSKKRRAENPTPDHVHGTQNGYGNYGCRCAPCTKAWADATRERAQRRRITGDNTGNIGKTNRWSGKISPQDAKDIRAAYANKSTTQIALANKYNISITAVRMILNNQSHLED